MSILNFTESDDILTRLRDFFIASPYFKSNFKTFKRGVFYPSASFPVLAILPRRMYISSYLVNSKYRLARDYTIQIYVRDTSREHSKSLALFYGDAAKQHLQKSYSTLHSNVYNISDFNLDFSGFFANDEAKVDLDFTLYSQEIFPTPSMITDFPFDYSARTIGDALFENCKRAKISNYRRLGKLTDIFYSSIPSIRSYPTLLIEPQSGEKDPRWFGAAHDYNMIFKLTLFTKLVDNELNLLYLLQLTDDLFKFLYASRSLADAVWRIDLMDVNYEMNIELDSYTSSTLLKTHSRDKVLFS